MTIQDRGAARAFRELHQGGLLVLPNAWDAGSARLMESLGARAIATTSAGVAWAHGYPDGDALPAPLLATTVSEIARVVRVPISADVEGGYADDPTQVGETVAALAGAGAVGINIEDGAGTPDLLCTKIEQVRRVADRVGVNLFVNARTDVYLRGLAPKGRLVEETLARADHYRAAGADGIFVPGVVDAREIRELAASLRMPLNVMARPGLPGAAELATLGVRRLSAGAALAEAALGRIAVLAREFLGTGNWGALGDGAMPYPEINALMR